MGGLGAVPEQETLLAGTWWFGLYNNIGTAPYSNPAMAALGLWWWLEHSCGGNGSNATGYGAGGAGGNSYASGSTRNGGAGSPGICIVTEYNIANAGPQGPAGPTGGVTGATTPPQGRLTLQSNTPVMTATVAGGSATVFYTPYIGDKIPIYDGSVWTMMTFTQQACTYNTGYQPAVIGLGKVNDWFSGTTEDARSRP